MKLMLPRAILRPLSVLLLALVAGAARAGADPDTSEIMRQKLLHSQSVLRGIALQDFGLIQTNAEQLVKLSQFGGWYARQSPEYELFTVEFRRHATDLVKAAKSQNIDAATLAYTQLTFSCVSCHRSMRGGGVQKVSLPLIQPQPADPKANRL
jgi:hypothetical protein